MRNAILIAALIAVGLFGSVVALRWRASHTPPILMVKLDGAAAHAVSGRLLIFATLASNARGQEKHGKVTQVDADPWHPKRTAVAAREIQRLAPGQTAEIDTDAIAFPEGFSQLPSGEYLMQAVLDQDHSYNYSGRDTGDLVSPVVSVRLPLLLPTTLPLVAMRSHPDPWKLDWETPDIRADATEARRDTRPLDITSRLLSTFTGRPIHMRGWVLLPPDYDTGDGERYPTVYVTHAYGGDKDSLVDDVVTVHLAMRKGEMPPMIWVFLDQSSATGTTEFANSVNNGPWGDALTQELIPELEAKYRMDAKPSGRLLTGHSSGGWATLWLQTQYPKLFGGTWSTSPDPVDFHDFSGVDIYAHNANFYHRPDGEPWPISRVHFHGEGSFADAARLERVLGPYGGQVSSYEWVFSPRNVNGTPMLLFDRFSGQVDPQVQAYWIEHYDIARYIRLNWPTLAPDLDGKIHIVVGTEDSWYLDGAVHKLKAVLDGLHARSDIRFLPNKAHMDLYAKGDDPNALLKEMSRQMYVVARGSAFPAQPKAAEAH
ncbi:alpha/beta hydrolase [Luteibacter sp.]|uniref:alpha/beta hydrolase n=1 Tax=Luteibacter sp. TaxID=1886636 RepID=UPI0039C925F3